MQTDLTKILKPGDKIFSIVAGKEQKVKAIVPDAEFPIEIGSTTGKSTIFKYNRYGSLLKDGGDCLLFPSLGERSWQNYSPFIKGDAVIVYDELAQEDKRIAIFSHMENGLYHVFANVDTDGKYQYMAFTNCAYFTCTDKA